MIRLDLRTRLLVGVATVAAVQVIAAVLLVVVTSDQLLDQIDDRLLVAAEVAEGSGRERIERISDVYQGVIDPNGELTTLNFVADRDDLAPPPDVDVATAVASGGEPFTVDALEGQSEYRLAAVDTGDGAVFVVGTLLNGYEFTLNRLTTFTVIASAVVMVVLGLVAWWVMRLGIRPIKRMTVAAESIAAGDLSRRIDGADPRTEAGQLGASLNTMMTHIETSFDERARTEEQLRQFIADASHELRTPVATIRGYAELFEAGGLRPGPELDDAMRRSREEAERLSRLFDDMLGLARLDRGGELQLGPVDLAALGRDAVADASVRRAEADVRAVAGPEPIIIEGDEDLLRQAITNVVDNAVVHGGDAADITVGIERGDGSATIVVADTGPGMNADAVARATERFYRADPSRSRARGGSGLGLAIVASIVDAHHGELAIASQPGEGTVVSMSFPLA